MKIYAKLRKYVDKNGCSSIHIIYNYKREKRAIATGLKCSRDDWNSNQGIVKKVAPYSEAINEALDIKKADVWEAYRNCLRQDLEPTAKRVLAALRGKDIVSGGFFDVLTAYINESKHNLSTSSFRKRESLRIALDNYHIQHKNLTFGAITPQWVLRFCQGLANGKYNKSRRKLSNYTIYQYVVMLIAFMRWSFKKNYHKNRSFLDFNDIFNKHFSVLLKDRPILTTEEIEAFRTVELEDKVDIEVRDAWMFQLHTSLRFSDVKRLSWMNIVGDHISIISKKTKTKGMYGISPLVREIIDNRNRRGIAHIFCFLPNNTEALLRLKEIAKKAGLTRNVLVSYANGMKSEEGSVVQKTVPLYEVMDTHTARHNFGYYYYNTYKDIYGLQKTLAHKNISTTQRYAKIDNESLMKRHVDLFASPVSVSSEG